MVSERPTPTAIPAERAVLGAMMLDDTGEVADRVLAFRGMSREAFYRPEHQALFDALQDLRLRQKPTDLLAVANVVALDPGRYGGGSYFTELPDAVVSTSNVEHYVEIVVEAAARRALVSMAYKLADEACDNVDPRSVAASFSERLALAVPAKADDVGPMTIAEALEAADRERGTGPAFRIGTGHPKLDELFGGGMAPGDLIVVAGRPSWGKTAFAIGMMIESARCGFRSGIISLEMSQGDIVDRVLSSLSGESIGSVQRGGFDPYDRDKIDRARDEMKDLPLLVDPRSGLSMQEIFQTAKLWQRTGGLDLLVIDYLGLVRHASSKNRTDAQNIGATVKNCKHLAKQLGVPVVLLAQLNRELVKGATVAKGGGDWWTKIPLPQLHHLRDSGDIEQDADRVVFPVPADVLRNQGILPKLDAPVGAAVLIVAKNRQGALGMVPARWDGATATYRAAENRDLRVVGGRDYGDHDFDDGGVE